MKCFCLNRMKLPYVLLLHISKYYCSLDWWGLNLIFYENLLKQGSYLDKLENQ